MDPVHDRGSMDPVHESGPWTWSKGGWSMDPWSMFCPHPEDLVSKEGTKICHLKHPEGPRCCSLKYDPKRFKKGLGLSG